MDNQPAPPRDITSHLKQSNPMPTNEQQYKPNIENWNQQHCHDITHERQQHKREHKKQPERKYKKQQQQQMEQLPAEDNPN